MPFLPQQRNSTAADRTPDLREVRFTEIFSVSPMICHSEERSDEESSTDRTQAYRAETFLMQIFRILPSEEQAEVLFFPVTFFDFFRLS